MKRHLTSKACEEDEELRLRELHSYEILDSPPEKEFQDLVELAGRICDASVAAITFIDKDRQWFKAKMGDSVSETSRLISFCAHTILSDEPLIIEDATKDHRFKENPDVRGGLNIRFYAGVPIYSRTKKRLGAVCVIGQKPGTISPAQIEVLHLVSKQVSYLLELRFQHKILNQYSQRVKEQSDQTFESFFINAKIAKWIYDAEDLQILQVNQKAVELYKYTREEFLEMKVYEIRPIEERKNIYQLLQNLQSYPDSATFITKHLTKDGRIIDVEVTISELVYLGRPARMASILDITENETLKKELRLQKIQNGQEIQHATLQARTEERDLLGQELHDNINQILAGIKLFLELGEKFEDMRLEMVTKCKEHIKEAIYEVRQLSHSLITPPKDEFSLSTSIQKLIESFKDTGTFFIETSMEGYLEELPQDLKLNLFRIIQEQVTNISKHADAERVDLNLSVGKEVFLEITDNGKGFDTRIKKKGVGLNNIKKRVEFYGGKLSISSQPGEGTSLSIRIPLPGDGITSNQKFRYAAN